MKIARTETFVETYRKLPLHIRKKIDKQIRFLATDISHPSLRVKKMRGIDRFEARVDRAYRFTFEKIDDVLFLQTVGPHDEGLGKN